MRVLVFLILILASFWIQPTWALDCVTPVMTDQRIEEAVAIFEGTVEHVERESPRVVRKVLQDIGIVGDDMIRTKIFFFKVTKSWKGVQVGDMVEVSRNTYWGDGFAQGVPYLIVAETLAEDRLVAEPCGLSSVLKHSGQSLEVLKIYFTGSGHKAP